MVDVSTSVRENIVAIEAQDVALHQFLRNLETVSDILRPEQLAKRLTLLDRLDAMLGDRSMGTGMNTPDSPILTHAQGIRQRLEEANEELYRQVRAEIAREGTSATFHQWLMDVAGNDGVGEPHSRLGFDARDEIVSGVLQFCEPGEPDLPQSPEMVQYQPTPVRHILDLIAISELSEEDVLVDLGSGLGHVPLLVSILTGRRTLGIEFQPAYVATAQDAAWKLGLLRTQFTAEDARLADLSSGTVFYLYSPFTGSILTEVLDRLRRESRERPIKICSLGRCTRVLAEQAWLQSDTEPDTERITVFKSQDVPGALREIAAF